MSEELPQIPPDHDAEDNPDGPLRFDFEDQVGELIANDAPNQNDLFSTNSPAVTAGGEKERSLKRREEVTKRPLDWFRQLAEDGHEPTALKCLTTRLEVDYQGSTIDPDSPTLSWPNALHFYDAQCLVSHEAGFDAFLPASRTDVDYSFNIEPLRVGKRLRDKHAYLGFDASGRTFRLGRKGSAEGFLILRPLNADDEPGRGALLGERTESSPLSKTRLTQITAFIAWCMQECTLGGIICHNRDGDLEDGERLEDITNFNSHGGISLDLPNMRRLGEFIRGAYPRWAAGSSPPGDTFFTDSELISVLAEYGQNRTICDETDIPARAADERSFQRNIPVDKLRYITWAVATVLRVKHIVGYSRYPFRDLQCEHGHIYRKTGEKYRRVNEKEYLGIDTMVPLDEIPQLFNNVRHAVKWVDPIFSPEPCGVLLDLDTIDAEFATGYGEDREAETEPLRWSRYLLGFSRRFGNVQASGPPTAFSLIAAEVNREISSNPDRAPALSVHHFQAYNELSHTLRPKSWLLEAAHGYLTRILAGAGTATGRKLDRIHELDRDVRNGNGPIDRARQKISVAQEKVGLRAEPTLVIDVRRLKPDLRSGNHLYSDMILPACTKWGTKKEVWERLLKVIVVLQPGVWPAALFHCSYPLAVAMKRLFEDTADVRSAGLPVEPYKVNLMSIFERAWAYGQTGMAKCLPNALLSQMFFMEHLRETGYFCFHGGLSFKCGVPTFDLRAWPTKLNQPLLPAAYSIKLNFGEGPLSTFVGRATVAYLIGTKPPGSQARDLNNTITSNAIQGLVSDLVNLVVKRVDVATPASQADAEVIAARKKALGEWSKLTHPFSLERDGFAVAKILTFTHAGGEPIALSLPTTLPSGHSAQISLDELATALACAVTGHGPGPSAQCASAIKAAAPRFLATATAMYAHISDSHDGHNERSSTQLFYLLRYGIKNAQLHFLPWIRPGRKGPPRLCIENWATLRETAQTAATTTAAASAALATPGERIVEQARAAAEQLSRVNPATPWSLEELDMQTLCVLIERATPPSQLSARKGDLDASKAIVTYHDLEAWVRVNFDMGKTQHRLAIMVAFVISRACPHLYIRPERDNSIASSTGKSAAECDAATDLIRQAGFRLAEGDKKKGNQDPIVWIEVFTYAIILWLEKTSPLLRDRVGADGRVGQINRKWTARIGAKSINAFLVVKAGLGKVTSPRSIYSKGMIWGCEWEVEDPAQLHKLYRRLMDNALTARRDSGMRLLQVYFNGAVLTQAAARSSVLGYGEPIHDPEDSDVEFIPPFASSSRFHRDY